MNVIARLEFELASYNVAVLNVSYYAIMPPTFREWHIEIIYLAHPLLSFAVYISVGLVIPSIDMQIQPNKQYFMVTNEGRSENKAFCLFKS